MTGKTLPSAPSFNTWAASLCAAINKIDIPWAIEEVLHARYNPEKTECEKFFTTQVVLHIFTYAETLHHKGSWTISMNESHQLSVTKDTTITSNLSTAPLPCKELLSLPANSSAAIDFQPLSSSPKDPNPLEEDTITPTSAAIDFQPLSSSPKDPNPLEEDTITPTSAAIDFQPLSCSSPKDPSPLEEDTITSETSAAIDFQPLSSSPKDPSPLEEDTITSETSAAIDFQPLSCSSPKDPNPLEEDTITPETTDTTIFSQDTITKKLLQIQDIISAALQDYSHRPKNLSDLVTAILNTPRASRFSSNQVDPDPYEAKRTFESHLALMPPVPEKLNLQQIHKLTIVAKRILTKKMPTITFSLLFKTFQEEALLCQTVLLLPSKKVYSPIGSNPVNRAILYPFQQRALVINTVFQENLAPTESEQSTVKIPMIQNALCELKRKSQIEFS